MAGLQGGPQPGGGRSRELQEVLLGPEQAPQSGRPRAVPPTGTRPSPGSASLATAPGCRASRRGSVPRAGSVQLRGDCSCCAPTDLRLRGPLLSPRERHWSHWLTLAWRSTRYVGAGWQRARLPFWRYTERPPAALRPPCARDLATGRKASA